MLPSKTQPLNFKLPKNFSQKAFCINLFFQLVEGRDFGLNMPASPCKSKTYLHFKEKNKNFENLIAKFPMEGPQVEETPRKILKNWIEELQQK